MLAVQTSWVHMVHSDLPHKPRHVCISLSITHFWLKEYDCTCCNQIVSLPDKGLWAMPDCSNSLALTDRQADRLTGLHCAPPPCLSLMNSHGCWNQWPVGGTIDQLVSSRKFMWPVIILSLQDECPGKLRKVLLSLHFKLCPYKSNKVTLEKINNTYWSALI